MLPDTERLRRAGLFQRTYAGKKSVSSPLVTLYVLPRQPRSAKRLPLVGFVVGKKVQNKASKRNLTKRRIREAYRLIRNQQPSLRQWYAMVWVIHKDAGSLPFDELCQTVAEAIRQAHSKYGKEDTMESGRQKHKTHEMKDSSEGDSAT